MDPKVEDAYVVVAQAIQWGRSAPNFKTRSNVTKQRNFVRATYGYDKGITDAQADAVCARLRDAQ